jgi:hypothetical protein
MGFSDRVDMFYEIPLAQYRSLSNVSGVPAGTDAIGMGDIDLNYYGDRKLRAGPLVKEVKRAVRGYSG